MAIEYFMRGSDNLIKLTLTEDGVAVSGAWTDVDIFVNNTLYIHRDNDGDGVTLDTTSGLLTISPGDLTALEQTALEDLTAEDYYPAQIVVTTVFNDDGAVFGRKHFVGQSGAGCDPLWFYISDKPV